jgi:hypothetical protein
MRQRPQAKSVCAIFSIAAPYQHRLRVVCGLHIELTYWFTMAASGIATVVITIIFAIVLSHSFMLSK